MVCARSLMAEGLSEPSPRTVPDSALTCFTRRSSIDRRGEGTRWRLVNERAACSTPLVRLIVVGKKRGPLAASSSLCPKEELKRKFWIDFADAGESRREKFGKISSDTQPYQGIKTVETCQNLLNLLPTCDLHSTNSSQRHGRTSRKATPGLDYTVVNLPHISLEGAGF